MTEQIALIALPPTLTDRQQQILDAVRRAGHDGLDTDQAGAILHARNGRHTVDDRCRYCGRDGKSVMRGELEPKGLVRYRRGSRNAPGAWIAVASPDEPGASRNDPERAAESDGAWSPGEPVPYGVIPF